MMATAEYGALRPRPTHEPFLMYTIMTNASRTVQYDHDTKASQLSQVATSEVVNVSSGP